MRKLNLNSLFFAALALFVFACGSSKSVASRGARSINEEAKINNTVEVSDNDKALSLANYLRRIPGIQVTGDGGSARVIVRGMAQGNEMPLFVLDGRRIGNDFATVNAAIDPVDIKRVQVLKDASSTSFYGLQGSGGVIKITSKKKN